jgi:uncharacterized protein
MKPTLPTPRRLGVLVVSAVVLAWVGSVVVLVLSENALVYPGAYHPHPRNALPRDTLALPWDTLSGKADDGARVLLFTSRLADRPAAPWILYFHGNGNYVGDWDSIERYRLFHRLGFDVLGIEYRGYGYGGHAKPSEEGLYADARAGWRYLTATLHVPPGRILIYGWSLGTGVAVELATEVHPAGLVTEGTFTSAPAVGRYHYPWVPVGLLMRNRFDNLSKVARITVPWLLFHGRYDRVVPFEEAPRLVGARPPHARLVPLSAGHNDGVTGDPATAEPALRAFADSLFSGGGAAEPAGGPATADFTRRGTSGSRDRPGGSPPAAWHR